MAKKTDYVGFDYGLGQTNIDKETGIRYGVINQNEVLQAWADSSEANYGEPRCPKCGNEAMNVDDQPECNYRDDVNDDEKYETARGACGDYVCDSCKYLFDAEDAFGDEPISFYLVDEEYKAEAGSDGDIFIFKSPYYTRCQFCSPCAPGAGYLMNEVEDGVKAYCFGHDWFEFGPAPYKVYRVADDTEVLPC